MNYSLIFTEDGWTYEPTPDNSTRNKTVFDSIGARNGARLVGFNDTAMRNRRLGQGNISSCHSFHDNGSLSMLPQDKPSPVDSVYVDKIPVLNNRGDIMVLTGDIVPVVAPGW
jgi:hypothetical protein